MPDPLQSLGPALAFTQHMVGAHGGVKLSADGPPPPAPPASAVFPFALSVSAWALFALVFRLFCRRQVVVVKSSKLQFCCHFYTAVFRCVRRFHAESFSPKKGFLELECWQFSTV